MKARLLQVLRLTRGILITTGAILIIATAVIVGVGRLLVPYADHARPQVERLLGQRTGQPVSIGQVEAHWSGLTPVLLLHNLKIGDPDEQPVSIARLQLEINLRDLPRRGRSPLWLATEGLEITVSQHTDGQWSVGLHAPALEQPAQLEPARIDLGNLLLRDSRLRLELAGQPQRTFDLPEIRLHTGGGHAALSGRIQPAGSEHAVDVHLAVELDDATPVSVRGWLNGRDLTLDDWLGTADNGALVPLTAAQLDLQAWLEWRDGETGRIFGELQLGQWPSGANGGARSINTEFILERDRTGVQLDINRLQFDGHEQAITDLRLASDGESWALALDQAALAPLHALLQPWPALSRWLPEQVSGRVEQLMLAGDRDGRLYAAAGRIRELETAPVERVPGVQRLALDLGLDGDLLAITLGGERPVVDWRGMLRAPIELDLLSGRILLGPDLLVIEDIAVEHPDAAVRAQGLIAWGGRRPFLDFQIDVPRVTPADPRPYLPVGILPETVLEWLDHALTGGERASGQLQFFGQPADWPWDSGTGEFLARINIEHATLGIYPGWPAAEALRGELVFRGRGMYGHTRQGRIGGIDVATAEVRIDDLNHEPLLILDLDAPAADAGALYQFLEQAPILEQTPLGDGIEYHGPIDLVLGLELPLGEAADDDWRLSGHATTEALQVVHAEHLFELDAVHGRVEFNHQRIGPARLHGRLNGGAVEIALDGVPDGRSTLTLNGSLAPHELIPPAWRQQFPEPLPAAGRSDWRIELERHAGATRLHASSDLAGTALALPAPLLKPADAAWAFSLSLPLQPAIDHLVLTLGERLALAARLDQDRWHWGLGLGGTPAPSPEAAHFTVRGEIDTLDLGGWLRTAGSWGAGGGWNAQTLDDITGSMQVSVNNLLVGKRSLGEINLELRHESPHWLLDVDGTGASGQLRLPASLGAANVAVGDFRHLHLSAPAAADDDEGQETETDYVMFDPRALPSLHLLVEDLRLGGLHAGLARVEAHGIADGLEIETLQAGGDALRLSGRGRWLMRDGEPASNFDLRLHFLDAHPLLDAAGFEAAMNARSGELALSAAWPGSPMDFDLRRLTGSLVMDLSDGNLPEARPGLGRVLGLISLTALPRRLQLDFRDVLGTGFSFDRLHGNFQLEAGRASTDDLKINAPAAEILITGTADLVARQYDQEILIRPGLGATLPLIGALAGGPGGAAAGLALQGLLGRPLRDIGEMRYRVTGPWDDPVVEVMSDE